MKKNTPIKSFIKKIRSWNTRFTNSKAGKILLREIRIPLIPRMIIRTFFIICFVIFILTFIAMVRDWDDFYEKYYGLRLRVNDLEYEIEKISEEEIEFDDYFDFESDQKDQNEDTEDEDKTRYYRHNLFPRTSSSDQNILIYPSSSKEDYSEMVIWDDEGYFWKSKPFMFCINNMDCYSTGIKEVWDLNSDGHPDIDVRNWYTGLGGHWTNIYFMYDPKTKGYKMAEFEWSKEALDDTGTTFNISNGKKEFSLWQPSTESKGICTNWSVYGQWIDQIHEDKTIVRYEICFQPKSKGSSKFQIDSLVEFTTPKCDKDDTNCDPDKVTLNPIYVRVNE